MPFHEGTAKMNPLFTIGYEATDIERFVSTLTHVGVKTVADVRAVPVSRKAGFSKRKLEAHLAAASIKYVHFVELGDPQPGRDAARAGEYDRFRQIYNAHIESAVATNALHELSQVAMEEATCLLCYERDPETCHRSIVAQRITDLEPLVTFDLFADDPQRYVRHAERVPRFHSSEGVAAA